MLSAGDRLPTVVESDASSFIVSAGFGHVKHFPTPRRMMIDGRKHGESTGRVFASHLRFAL